MSILLPKHPHRTTTITHQCAPVLPSPKNEPFPARRNPRTLEALWQHVHREFSATMFCLNKYRNSREQATQPERRLGDECREQPHRDTRPSNKSTMHILRGAEVTFIKGSRISQGRTTVDKDNDECSTAPWYMATNTPRNAALRMVPQLARNTIGVGARATALRLKSNIGTICSAPYIGSVHLKTAKKRSIGENMQLATCGCDAEHGPYGGCATRQTSRAVTFPGCRSLRHDTRLSNDG